VERDELRRLFPPDVDEIKPYLTDEVLNMYDVVCEVLFWGDWRGESIHVSTSESGSKDFADWRLYWIKAKVDRYFSVTARALRRAERERREAAAAGHEADGNVALPDLERERPRALAGVSQT
jgi:hypothetical protein